MIEEAGVTQLSRWVRCFCILAFILLLLSFVYSWWHVFEAREVRIALNVPVSFELVTGYQWGLAFLLSCIPLLLTMVAVGHIYRLMGLFLRSEFFSVRTSQSLYRFSFWLLLGTVSKIVCDTLMSMVLTLNNPGGGLLAVGLDSKTMGTLFIVSIFFVITRIMKEGIKLTEENAEFI